MPHPNQMRPKTQGLPYLIHTCIPEGLQNMTFLRDARRWGLRVAVSNLRFSLGYRVGGFTSAKR